MDKVNEIILGDCLKELKKLDDNSIDSCITDPPYGYSFMGKDWDKAVPSVEIWQECLRVLKPGAFLCVMSAPRSDVQMHMIQNLTKAGFRLDFTPIYWTYASGFPKAGNIGKMVDKRLGTERGKLQARVGYVNDVNHKGGDYTGEFPDNNPITDEAKALDGSYAGFQPKPAVEVIIVAMKPLSEKTYVDQALKNGKGITWLDDCRIPTDQPDYEKNTNRTNVKGHWGNSEGDAEVIANPQGRFSANLLVSDDVLNDGRTFKGEKRTKILARKGRGDNGTYGDYGKTIHNTPSYPDSGSYSRYFDLDKWAKTLPFLIVPKASKSEKNEGLNNFQIKQSQGGGGGIGDYKDDVNSASGKYGSEKAPARNFHPTVKPLKLMSYLITLFSREGDIVLDPFVGSGTTCLAAKKLKRKYIGIERESEYVEIAKARLEADKQEVLL